jgi:hypothetical protein
MNSMTAPGFIDTNILVCAFADTGDGRHAEARELVEGPLDGQNARIGHGSVELWPRSMRRFSWFGCGDAAR